MKKLLAVVLAVVLVFSMAAVSFAAVDGFEDDQDGEVSLGQSINDKDYAYPANLFRGDYTASRQWSGTATGIIEAGNGGHVAKLTDNQYFNTDAGPNSGKKVLSFTLKATTFDSFAGIVIDENELTDGSSAGSIDVSEYGVGKYTDSQDLIFHSGYGFTLLAADHNKIRLYVNASATGSPDYADFDLGFDCTAAYHTYAIYKDCDARKAYVYADDKQIGYFDFSVASELMGIYDAEGNPKAIDTNDNFSTANSAAVCFLKGNGIEVYLDNLAYGEWTDLPIEQNPATGDASIVAFVAVAACVALVVLKKKETI